MMKIQLPLFILLFFTAFGHAQECEEVTINLTATPATSPTSFDGSIEVELEGEGVVETYFWSNGWRNMPAFMDVSEIFGASIPVWRAYPLELNGLAGDEIVLIDANSSFQIAYLIDGEWITSEVYSINNACNNALIRDVKAGDVTGDGLIDLVFGLSDYCSDPLYAFKIYQASDGGLNYSPLDQLQTLNSPNSVTACRPYLIDFDSDGDIDIISTGNSNSGGQVSRLWINDGSGQFIASENYLLCETNSVEVFDYDSDGDLDVFATGLYGNCQGFLDNVGASFFENTGLNFNQSLNFPPNSIYTTKGTYDFNNDGFPDILIENPTSILFSDGNAGWLNNTTPLVYTESNYVGAPIEAVDLNYDGYIDILTETESPGAPSAFYTLMNNNGEGFDEFPSASFPLSGLFTELSITFADRFIYQGNLIERGVILTNQSQNIVYLAKQINPLNQTGLPPGEYELCLNTTDGCEYCNSVTVTSESGYDCTDSEACNYNPNATEDDGSCEYGSYPYDCDGNCLNDADENGICDEFEQAAPYNPDSNGDGIINLLDLLEIFPLFGQPIETVPCISPE